MKELNASFQRYVHADKTADAIGRLLYKTQDKEHLKNADGLVKSQKGLKESMEMCGNIQAAYDRAHRTIGGSMHTQTQARLRFPP